MGRPLPAPPKLAVAEAGLLHESRAELRHTAGTLVELHRLGALRIEDPIRAPQRLVLLDPAAVTHGHHRALLEGLFPVPRPGETRQLSGEGSETRHLQAAHAAMRQTLFEQVASYSWYARLPARRLWRWSDGMLTTEGHRQAEQVQSFAQYVGSASTDDLTRNDLIRLLPWALVFGLGERWQELVHGPTGDDPAWWTEAGMFGIGRFRRGLAGFVRDTRVGGSDGPAGDGLGGE
ncbi:DUF2207 domain-containing protein [Kribbella sp. ALI-6-A]|uniref:DUF2207 domain-containing protein n=1 Tax=Kribbella sp. ALI-6-A TaxID=1933817 RepID=UPI00117B8D5E|nr:DUF2207 domain-containing protein [Kribbella sp. ALI-6-A]